VQFESLLVFLKILTDFSDFMLNSLVIASINPSHLYFPRVGLVSLSIEEYCDKSVLLISQMAENFVFRCRLCAFQISDCSIFVLCVNIRYGSTIFGLDLLFCWQPGLVVPHMLLCMWSSDKLFNEIYNTCMLLVFLCINRNRICYGYVNNDKIIIVKSSNKY